MDGGTLEFLAPSGIDRTTLSSRISRMPWHVLLHTVKWVVVGHCGGGEIWCRTVLGYAWISRRVIDYIMDSRDCYTSNWQIQQSDTRLLSEDGRGTASACIYSHTGWSSALRNRTERTICFTPIASAPHRTRLAFYIKASTLIYIPHSQLMSRDSIAANFQWYCSGMDHRWHSVYCMSVHGVSTGWTTKFPAHSLPHTIGKKRLSYSGNDMRSILFNRIARRAEFHRHAWLSHIKNKD